MLRSCLVSSVGHAAGLVSLALLTGGAPGGPTTDRPSLVASVSEGHAPLEVEQIIQTAQPESQQADLAAALAPSYVHESGTNVPRYFIGAPGPFADSQPVGLSLDVGLADQFDEMQGDVRKPLGRTANFYGIEAEGSKFVFVMDMSGSMSGARFRRARNELRQAIERLSPTQAFFVILFNDAPNPMPAAGLTNVNSENVQLVDAWLRKIECQGGTHPFPALLAALAMKPDAVFLLSDGKFDPTTAQAVSQLESWQRIPIHTIGFASRKGEPMLRAISQVSGGTYRYVH